MNPTSSTETSPRREPTCTATTDPIDTLKTDELPKLTPTEFREWNRLSEHMSMFHEHFKDGFRKIWNDADDVEPDEEGALEEFLDQADDLYIHLSAHHGIEERYVFPVLAKRMPQFTASGQHKKEHEEMHTGLEKYHKYLQQCHRSRNEWSAARLRENMAFFEQTLFDHMDAEVQTLGADSLRRAGWTLAELKTLPF